MPCQGTCKSSFQKCPETPASKRGIVCHLCDPSVRGCTDFLFLDAFVKSRHLYSASMLDLEVGFLFGKLSGVGDPDVRARLTLERKGRCLCDQVFDARAVVLSLPREGSVVS